MTYAVLAKAKFAEFLTADTLGISALCFLAAVVVIAGGFFLIKFSNSIQIMDEEEE